MTSLNVRKPSIMNVHIPADSFLEQPRSASITKSLALQPKTRTTLQELWWKVEQDFNKENPGHHLGAQISADRSNVQIAKNSVLDKWRQRYQADESDSARHKQQITTYMNNVLNALELVGSFASQAAACAFPPAGLCFSALQFLINAPKHIHKVYEDLEKLFIQVDRFLMQFSIYQRMDDNFGLDETLIVNANKLLIQFVKICGLSVKLLEGGKRQTIKQGFKTVLFGDDAGVQAELDTFESLARFNNELTDTITLEHVLQSEENTERILRDNNALVASVGHLLANSNDEKMVVTNKDRLDKIRKKMFGSKPPADEEMAPSSFQEDFVPNTFETIRSSTEYGEWESGSVAALLIWGSQGTGKSRMMDAIKSHLDGLRNNADRNLPSIYVATFNFSKKISNTTGRKKYDRSLVPHALRVLAYQVAKQSTTYAQDLFVQLEENNVKEADSDNESVWGSLRLGKLSIMPTPTLYILLDSVDEELEDTRAILRFIADKREVEFLHVKILLTARRFDDRFDSAIQNGCLALSASSIKDRLLAPFVQGKMIEMNIFQDADKASRLLRQQVFKGLTQPRMTFSKAVEKLYKTKNAIENSAPRSIITEILKEENAGSTAKEGQAVLEAFESSLNPADLKLLSSILMWLIGSEGAALPSGLLESALRLEGADLPIEALEKKIKNTFSKVIAWRGSDMVELQPSVESCLKEQHEWSRSRSTESLISLDISIKDASRSRVIQFVWDLHENLVKGSFDFNVRNRTDQKLQVSRLKTHLTILRLCCKVWTEGWNEDTKDMIGYADIEIPRQFLLLKEIQHLVEVSHRRDIGGWLIAFLRDTHAFAERHQSYDGFRWLQNQDKVDAIRYWLQDPETVQQLPIKEQRWISRVLHSQNGDLGFLDDLLRSICDRWLADRKSNSGAMSDWLWNYLDAVKFWDDERVMKMESSPRISGMADDGTESMTSAEIEDNDAVRDFENLMYTDTTIHSDLDRVTNNSSHSGKGSLAEVEESEVAGDDTDTSYVGPTPREQGPDSQRASPAECLKRHETLDSYEPIEVTPAPTDQRSVATVFADTVDEAVQRPSERQSQRHAEALSELLELAHRYTTPVEDAVYHYNLGRMCYEDSEFTRASNYLNKALKMVRAEKSSSLQFLGGCILECLARCRESLEDRDGASELASTAFKTIAELDSDGKLIDEWDQDYYVTQLIQWASKFQDRDPHRSLAWYETAYNIAKRDEQRLMCRWAVLKLRCHVDNTQETALQFLEEWSTERELYDQTGPDVSLLEILERHDEIEMLLQFGCCLRNERLRARLITICAQALKLAGNEQSWVKGRLFWVQANICLGSKVPEILQQALSFYESALAGYVEDPESEMYTDAIPGLARSIVQYKFDAILTEIEVKESAPNHEMLLASKRQLERDFESTIAKHPMIRFSRGVDSAATYVVSFCSLFNMIDDARTLWKDQMADAIEILSDSDPENDRQGAKILARIFCFLGDHTGMLTAFSLLDRSINLERSKNNGKLHGELSLERKIENGWYHSCAGCWKSICSSDETGIWWCRYCPDMDLCSDCKAKHDSGSLRMRYCSPAHAETFYHLTHTDYTVEELESTNDNIRVTTDWTFERDVSARGGWTRKGGRTRSLADWIEELRKEWDLPEPVGDVSRAQK